MNGKLLFKTVALFSFYLLAFEDHWSSLSVSFFRKGACVRLLSPERMFAPILGDPLQSGWLTGLMKLPFLKHYQHPYLWII